MGRQSVGLCGRRRSIDREPRDHGDPILGTVEPGNHGSYLNIKDKGEDRKVSTIAASATASVSDGQKSLKRTRSASPDFHTFAYPAPSFAPIPHARSITDSSRPTSKMDASTPLKRSSTDAGLDSPRESNRSTDSRPVAPRISKARACKPAASPTWSDRNLLRTDSPF
jgi:hypothetical protein